MKWILKLVTLKLKSRSFEIVKQILTVSSSIVIIHTVKGMNLPFFDRLFEVGKTICSLRCCLFPTTMVVFLSRYVDFGSSVNGFGTVYSIPVFHQCK